MVKTYLTLFTLLLGLASHSQTLRGIVTDEQGTELTGAYIYHPTSGHHVHTDIQGRFEMDGVQAGDSIHVSFIGFKTEKLTIQSVDRELKVILAIQVNLLSEVRIRPRSELSDMINELDLITRPVTNSQTVLRKVPGLFIAQHAGGGKAEQIFLRGFDIDHGTDVAIDVDGMPVNMVSHAHGQGYADLHFLIPETIDRIEFDKGGYDASVGNFSTAGHISLRTKDRLEGSSLQIEGGQFSTARLTGLFQIADKKNHGGYIALERLSTDGPFTSPQDLQRTNLQLHYDMQLDDRNRFDLHLSHFTSRWDASGQIPQRAIDQGLIDRWGAIDDTEGGETNRSDLILAWENRFDPTWTLVNTFSLSHYSFDLFSNFTFNLEEPEYGDQIRQNESRYLYSWRSELSHPLSIGDWETEIQGGVSWRYDDISDSYLARTVGRDSLLRRLSYADMQESNLAAYASWRWIHGRLSITPGLRIDRFEFVHRDRLDNREVKQVNSAYALSPKLKLDYIHSDHLKSYLYLGQSFHSNDMRMTLGENPTSSALPASLGADIGLIWKPSPQVFVQAAAWYLELEQEFVYVGDEAIIEPSGATQRSGADLSARILLSQNVVIHADATYSFARSIDEENGEDYIPLAPEWTASGGITYSSDLGLSASLTSRYLGDRPANEDYSQVADGYLILDADIGYSWKRVRVFVNLDNLFDTEWKEAQFLTRSRLPGEAAEGIEEIHFTPGTPRAIYGGVRLNL
ncbi:MAG: TonB-dependent receptor [Flavobacteriales bacterium]|nr:TonB-dependent receptor [Flavobacteriales bacterium]